MQSKDARAATSCQSSHPHCSIVFRSCCLWVSFHGESSGFSTLITLFGEGAADWWSAAVVGLIVQYTRKRPSEVGVLKELFSIDADVSWSGFSHSIAFRWPRGALLKQLTVQLIYISASWQIEIYKLSPNLFFCNTQHSERKHVKLVFCNPAPLTINRSSTNPLYSLIIFFPDEHEGTF